MGVFILPFTILRPTEMGVVERFGKYNRPANPGLVLGIPFFESSIVVNVTERLMVAQPQEVITQDNLNCTVNAQIYFKVLPNNESVRKALYNVDDFKIQITSIAQTTLRDIIGKNVFKDVNSNRQKLNAQLAEELRGQTAAWGIEIVRTELMEISPPQDVQETMNKVLKAENEKIAAVDFATATETRADGEKRASIRQAEGIAKSIQLKAEADKQAKILNAEGEAEYIKK